MSREPSASVVFPLSVGVGSSSIALRVVVGLVVVLLITGAGPPV
jgi:hypothetical protein